MRRRFVKRIYIPLPDTLSRKQLLSMLLSDCKHNLLDSDLDELVVKTEGFSGTRCCLVASWWQCRYNEISFMKYIA